MYYNFDHQMSLRVNAGIKTVHYNNKNALFR
jgi:hypothetical protein